jgi:hypothetical protein
METGFVGHADCACTNVPAAASAANMNTLSMPPPELFLMVEILASGFRAQRTLQGSIRVALKKSPGKV